MSSPENHNLRGFGRRSQYLSEPSSPQNREKVGYLSQEERIVCYLISTLSDDGGNFISSIGDPVIEPALRGFILDLTTSYGREKAFII